jgi:hypothetical protein
VLGATEVEQPVHPFVGVRRHLDEVIVVADRARQDLEQRDLTDVLVGDRLEHVGEGLAVRIGVDVDLVAAGRHLRWPIRRRRSELTDEVGESVDSDAGVT